jgi:hypothetical protein
VLDGGSCELVEATVRRRSHAEYFSTQCEFSNGQTVEFPLYLPYSNSDDLAKLAAEELAKRLGQDAAVKGRVDVAEWINEGSIPLHAYVIGLIDKARQSIPNSEKIQFSTKLLAKKSGGLYCVNLFAGDESTTRKTLSIALPTECARPNFKAAIDRTVEEHLGVLARRTFLKSSANSRLNDVDAYTIQSPLSTRLKNYPGQNAQLYFLRSDTGQSVHVSLSTSEPAIAKARYEQMTRFINDELTSKGKITVSELRHYAEKHFATDKHVPLSRPRYVLGPVIVYKPSDGLAKPTEAMRCYIGIWGTEQKGFNFQLSVVPPDGQLCDSMYRTACRLPPDVGLTLNNAEELKVALHAFVHDRLSRFYLAGGQFRDQEDIGFGGANGAALTPQGADKFQRVLQGRMKSAYVTAALRAGISNPFDQTLGSELLTRLGADLTRLQPAHASFRLENTRMSSGPGDKEVRTTLIWSANDGRELSRYDLQFKNMGDFSNLVAEIDQWTTDNLSPDHSLPEHTGREFLRTVMPRALAPNAHAPVRS